MSVNAAAAKVAEFALGLTAADVPEPVRAAAKMHLLDTLGCGIAAAATSTAAEARELAAESGGAAQATVIGLEQRMPAAPAAMANGMLCHGLDYDDTLASTGTHISTVAGPAALAVAERVGAGGEAALVAYLAAAETVAALGLAAPFAMHRRGFHATSVYGVFGAAAAAARLLGLTPDQMVGALGIAGSLASGIFEYLADGAPTKPIHAGWAAQAGITAALLAERGARGPATVLEGRFGLFATHADMKETALDDSLAQLGLTWRTPEIAFKPFPSCHFMHGALHAARDAMAGLTVSPAEVDSVTASVAADAVEFVLEPLADKVEPRTGYDAKFSLPFSVAAVLVDGDVGVGTYAAERLDDPRLLALAAKVRYEVKPYPDAFAGAARIELADGRVLESEAATPGGEPMADDEVIRKFRANAALGLDPAGVRSLERGVLGLEQIADLSQLLAPLRVAGAAQPVA